MWMLRHDFDEDCILWANNTLHKTDTIKFLRTMPV